MSGFYPVEFRDFFLGNIFSCSFRPILISNASFFFAFMLHTGIMSVMVAILDLLVVHHSLEFFNFERIARDLASFTMFATILTLSAN